MTQGSKDNGSVHELALLLLPVFEHYARSGERGLNVEVTVSPICFAGVCSHQNV